MSKNLAITSTKRTAPVSTVLELELHYRPRYVAWSVIVIAWLASLTAIMMRGAAPEWLLFTAMSFIFLSSGVLPLLAAYKLDYERTISAAMVEQGQLQVEITVKRKLPVPGVWYLVNDQLLNSSTMRGERLKLRASFLPLFHRTMSVAYTIKELERGSYASKQTSIQIIDWLGLTCMTLKRNNAASFIVLPQYEEPEEASYVARNTSSVWKKQQSANKASIGTSLTPTRGNLHEADADRAGGQLHTEGVEHTTRPYAAGDNYRRLDSRAAARGNGLHTRMALADDNSPKLCILLDQYDLPYEESQQDQLFHSLVQWTLADAVQAGEQQNVSILCDNWSFEYCGAQHNEELKHLLALTRPDVALNMKERVPFFSPLLPSNGHIIVYSGAWKDSEGWIALAEAAWLKGNSVELHFVTTNRVMTYAMREQQKVLETAGMQIVWRYSYGKPSTIIEVAQGSERYASGT